MEYNDKTLIDLENFLARIGNVGGFANGDKIGH
jgi:hypothetical protein